MRIISQDGCSDLSYEYCSLELDGKKKCKIQAMRIGDNFGLEIAEYSDEEKAKRALRKLHEVYRESDGNGIFQFPGEYEI